MGRNDGNLWSEMQRAIHTTEWLLTYESWRVIACSQYMAWEIGTYFGVPRDKIDVIPNGVDPRSFDSLHDIDMSSFRLGFAEPHQPIVYYVGRIVREKGLQVLLDAVPLILREMPDVRFVLAGSGVYAVDLRAKAYALDIADNIIFTGRVSDEVRDALFKVADCAVFPSLYEPFGIVALEAMAAGTPVVVSDVGGLSEVVELHETGIKVQPGNPESLAWGILHTLRHPDWSRERAAKASKVVRSEYTWPHIAESTEGVYRRIAEEARAGHWAYKI
jgi:glycosyltransferase involved in cell wall biosynthesis